MNIDKVNEEMQEAWFTGNDVLLHELAGDMVDEIRRLREVIEGTNTVANGSIYQGETMEQRLLVIAAVTAEALQTEEST